MNLKEYYRERLNNLLSEEISSREEKAKKQSLEKQSDVALGELEGLLSGARERMQGSSDLRLAAHHKTLANHFMDAYNHHMVGEYEQAIQVARRGIEANQAPRNPATWEERQAQWDSMYDRTKRNRTKNSAAPRNPATWEERQAQWDNMYGNTKNPAP